MGHASIINRIRDCGLMPIVRFDLPGQIMGIVEALYGAGVDVVEFPMTSAFALKAIEKVSDAYGDKVIVGAGTVLDGHTARACMLAGARFIVSPSLCEEVVRACRRYSMVACPGALTPSEVLHAWETGADFVKIFPCGAVGGASYIRSLKAPFPHIEMIPVGGVSVENAADFIDAGSAALGAGQGLIDRQALAASHYEVIAENAARFMNGIRKARSHDPG